jgi:hypothetical protein
MVCWPTWRACRDPSATAANLARVPRPFGKSGPDQVGLTLELTASLANRLEEPLEGVDEPALDFDVARLPDGIALFELLHLGCIGIERVVVVEYRVARHMDGVCCAQASRISEHLTLLVTVAGSSFR